MKRTSFAILLLAALLVANSALASPPRPDGPEQPDRAIRLAAACAPPVTQTIRGKAVEFDQCYDHAFSHDGTDYLIHTYYTETNSTTNTDQCEPINGIDDDGDGEVDEDSANRCEHALTDNDNGNGDNIRAVEVAQEGEAALRFYYDHNLDPLGAGETEMNIYIAEDPKGGWIVAPNGFYVDDDRMDDNDTLTKRWHVYHEMQHLIQEKYNDDIGWETWYSEGIARAVEDRVDVDLDASTGHAFQSDAENVLAEDDTRSSDVLDISYKAVLWWTWLMDQYRVNGESEPDTGWEALRDFYLTFADAGTSSLTAVEDFLTDQSSSFDKDFVDYTLALYAYRFSPADARLGFLDAEINTASGGLSGHTVITGGPGLTSVEQAMNPRSSRYWEFDPASQCDYITFGFDGQGKDYAFSVMTVDGGTLQKRWTSVSDTWARTVRSADLDRVAGVVTALDESGDVDLTYGCVDPSINIKSPTTSAYKMVGLADNPRQFIVRLKVTGAEESGVAGLTADDFQVQIRKLGGGELIDADVVNAAYAQDDYWLLVQAPGTADGAESGAFYDLVVTLGAATDTETGALVYIERTQDVMIVLDRSGSMGGGTGKIESARNAAALMIAELSNDDQGGFVAFDEDADLREGLSQVGLAGHRVALETAIAAELPGGSTSIGDGMQTAAVEQDAQGLEENLCSLVLLSDGHENAPALWEDVQAGVIDNGCAMHVTGFGPGANEALLQQIAGSGAEGSYDYATTSGDVPIGPDGAGLAPLDASPAAATVVGWQNNLSRVYDGKAAQIAGRQRIFSMAASNQSTATYNFAVDDTSDELILALAWQTPVSAQPVVTLIPPSGTPVPVAFRRVSPLGTNQVWRVPDPEPGSWQLIVINLPQEHYISATARTQLELFLFAGAPLASATQGERVPIVATFARLGQPIVGGTVDAVVTAPNGFEHTLHLHDDGNHGDSEANDGVYGNFYTVTSFGEQIAQQPPVEGAEPQSVGSYLVSAVGTWKGHRREAQASFVLTLGTDSDGDGIPDGWEGQHGLNPTDPNDGREDPDGDGVLNLCEFRTGTEPDNSDTDGGGESDGSEMASVTACVPGTQDPLDPTDDRVGAIGVLRALPEATLTNRPSIHVHWNRPARGVLRSVDLLRRIYTSEGKLQQDWQLIANDLAGTEFVDERVVDGLRYEYRIVPLVDFNTQTVALAVAGTVGGRILTSNIAQASADPYPPAGTVTIDDGALVARSKIVTLSLTADDSADDHGDEQRRASQGTPPAALMMRISNSPGFAGAPWQPFQPVVQGWDLGAVLPGQPAIVYVQFKDAQGNIGDTGFDQSDSILYQPSVVHLPLIAR